MRSAYASIPQTAYRKTFTRLMLTVTPILMTRLTVPEGHIYQVIYVSSVRLTKFGFMTGLLRFTPQSGIINLIKKKKSLLQY